MIQSMPKKQLTFDTVRQLARALPDVEETTMYGTPALRVRGNWVALVPTHKSAEPGSLAFRVDVAQREELIAAQPETYYVKEHYIPHPVVLVRLAHIHPDALADLLTMSWRLAAAAKARPARKRTALKGAGAKSSPRPSSRPLRRRPVR